MRQTTSIDRSKRLPAEDDRERQKEDREAAGIGGDDDLTDDELDELEDEALEDEADEDDM
jgi:hypothetical protein